MDNPKFVDIPDERAILVGKDRELWLPTTESARLNPQVEIVNVAGQHFDVVGYSSVREALLLSPIVIDGAAENIEDELEAYLAN